MLVEDETAKLLAVTPPPTFTVVAPTTKFVPVKVTVIAVPAMPVLGDIEVSVGPVSVGTTANDTDPLLPPAVVTATLCEPRPAPESMVKLAVMLVEDETAKLLAVTPLPLTLTVVPPTTKFVPVKVTVSAVPEKPVVGDIEVSVGGNAAALTVKVNALVVPTDVITRTL
jgi:hypothetical protein